MTLTAMIVVGAIIALAIYDLLVVSCGGLQYSISRYLQNSALKSPFISFAFGFVCGHIFGYMPPEIDKNVENVNNAVYNITEEKQPISFRSRDAY